MNAEENFALEKYKYILSRKQSLNEATFKIAAIYQAVMIGVGVAQYSVLASLGSKGIESKLALYASLCLMGVVVAVALLVMSLLVGGIMAWLKYRSDESLITSRFLGYPKEKIKITSIFSWYETYLAIVIFAVSVASLYGYWAILLPSIV